MKPEAVLFDLGNTLAAYYQRREFGPVLEQAVDGLLAEAARRGVGVPQRELALQRAVNENREAADFRFTPMAERFDRILGAEVSRQQETAMALCAHFLAPIFALGRVYDDVLPALHRLRDAGIRTAIVSNAPWGSPPALWHRELRRLGLADAVDCVLMCGDVGWRKPAPLIFDRAAQRLGMRCEACVFVGDEPEWDVRGSAAVGMRPVLLDRYSTHPLHDGERIESLADLLVVLALHE